MARAGAAGHLRWCARAPPAPRSAATLLLCAIGLLLAPQAAAAPATSASRALFPAGLRLTRAASTSALAPRRLAAGAGVCAENKCPAGSVCQALRDYGGRIVDVAICRCTARGTHFRAGKCAPGRLAHSDFLDAHNAVRAALGLRFVVWDARAAAAALQWARGLQARGCVMEHPRDPNYPFGQNLAWVQGYPASFTNASAVKMWVAEGAMYTRAAFPGGCSTGNWADCGHYTQIVWQTSVRVGCAVVSCSGNQRLWVCNYSPPGNYLDKLPY